MLVDQLEEPPNQFVSLEIADLSQSEAAAEVLIPVGITAGAPQRALASDFNRERGSIAAQNSSPRRDDPFHGGTISPAAFSAPPRSPVSHCD